MGLQNPHRREKKKKGKAAISWPEMDWLQERKEKR